MITLAPGGGPAGLAGLGLLPQREVVLVPLLIGVAGADGALTLGHVRLARVSRERLELAVRCGGFD